ncbi:MAG: hypothetical protein ACLFM0_02190 [Spirochaetales bacterium]
MACVELPRFRLQLLLRTHKQWRDMPVALVSEDRPLAPVLEVNSAADSAGVEPGMKYATALTVVPDLQADVIREDTVEEAVNELYALFQKFSPAVEQWDITEGVFWLDCEGLLRLWRSLYSWSGEVRAAVAEYQLYSRVAVGFSRFATFVTAVRGGTDAIVIHDSPDSEHEQALAMPLRRLPLDATGIARLERLGIRTIRGFQGLDGGSIASRFGARAETLHGFVTGKSKLPIHGRSEAPSYHAEQEMPGLRNREAIASQLVPALQHLCSQLRLRGRRAAELTVYLRDERGGEYTEVISPAEPSGDALFLNKLLLLRLYTLQIGARVVHAALSMSPAHEERGQALLFTQYDEHGASWARARSLLQAEFGNEALVRVILCDAHHPAERFRLVAEGAAEFDAAEELSAGTGDIQGASRRRSPARLRPRGAGTGDIQGASRRTAKENADYPVLVRRVLFEPLQCKGIPAGVRFGPFRVSGRWWRRESGLSYYYLWRKRGAALWLYRQGERTMLQGYVE